MGMWVSQTCPTRCTGNLSKKVRTELFKNFCIELADFKIFSSFIPNRKIERGSLGFEFTLMVAGESGLGKSTLIDR